MNNKTGVRAYSHSGAIPGTAVVKPLAGITLRRVMIAIPTLFLPFFLGGARPWFWSVFAALFMIGAAAVLWIDPETLSPAQDIPLEALAAGAVILAIPVLQLIPLPPSVLAVLDPHRLLWLQRATEATGNPQGWATISYIPVMTLFSMFWWVFLVLFALFLRNTLCRGSPEWFFRILFFVAATEALYGILQALTPSLGVLWEAVGTGDARGTFVNRNHFAAFLGMIWPVLLGYVLSLNVHSSKTPGRSSYDVRERRAQTRQKQIFLAFLVGLVLFALVFSESRGGILSALLSLTAFTIVGRIRRRGMLALLVASWAVMIAYGSIVGFGNVIARFDALEGGAAGRFKIWTDSCRLIGDHFLTGTGLDTFARAIRLYQSHLLDNQEIVHAHNDYLELAGELGIPVAAGLSALAWGFWILTARRVWKIDPDEGMSRKEKPTSQAGMHPAPAAMSGAATAGTAKDGAGHETEPGEREVAASGLEVHPSSAGVSSASSRPQRAGTILGAYGSRLNSRLITAGALAGSLAFLCHGVVEFNWQIPANQVYFIILLVLMSL